MQSKIITATIGAAGLGALWGWAVTGDRMERQLWEKEAYLQAMRSMYLELRGEYAELAEAVSDDVLAHLESENSPGEETPEEDVTGENDESSEEGDEEGEVDEEEFEATRANLTQIIDKYAADPEVSEAFDRIVRRDREVAGAREKPPFVISKAEYAWGEETDDFEKVTITWYPRFRVMIDEDNEEIDDVRNVIGFQNLSQFGGESGDPDVVYVRNQRLMTDYEVVMDEEGNPPLHVRYGMDKETFAARKAAGTLRLRDEDRD